MSSRSARNAISWASRLSSTGRPSSSSATAARSRSRSRTSRSGARAAIRAAAALQQIEPVPQLVAERVAFARPHGAALGGGLRDDRLDLAPGDLEPRRRSPLGEHLGLPGDQLERHLAAESERRLQLPQPRRDQPRPLEVHREAARARGILGPPRLHRHVPAVELLPQPLPELRLERRQVGRQLGGQIEVPVIDRPDLDPEPAAGHGALRGAEPGHAVRQAYLLEPGKPGNLPRSEVAGRSGSTGDRRTWGSRRTAC